MKHIGIQLVVFLLVALTPFVSWFALPLYILLNPLLALASAALVLGTSRQDGSQLVLDRNSAGSIILRVWYWTNISLAVPCVLFLPFAIAGIMHPFGGFAGSSEFVNKSGFDAKRSMNEWPSNVAPSNVRLVSRKHDYSIDSHSSWYKIELDIDSAQKWADSVHSIRELRSRQSIGRDDRGLEAVRRVIPGPPPLHWKTGDSPNWWTPPPIEFRATEAMKWYPGYDSGVGQAAYTGYDANDRTLWVYEYSCQHDRLWEPNQIPDGDIFSRLKDTEPNDGPMPPMIPSDL